MNHFIFLLGFLLLANAQGQISSSKIGKGTSSASCKEWVDSVYNSLNEDERIAQLMMVNISPKNGEQSKATIRTMVDKYHVGGVFLYKGTVAQFVEMTNYAQSIAKVPLLMGIDGEWGPAMRISDTEAFPQNMEIGAIQDPNLIYKYGQESARQFKALGIYVNFGPVLDVNSNPKNPVIGRRSFGEDPKRVAELGKAYSLGLESSGVLSVAKHFPGHGDTNTDSHKALPTIHHDRAMLDSVDLYPFKKYIGANCSGIMVGHLNVPAFDNSGQPSSMSKKIVTDLLKNKLGFSGLVFTDGLGMKGAAVNENLCVAALMAGNDVLVGPQNVGNDIAAIREAVAKGKIPMSEIESRCKKMLAYKYSLGLYDIKPLDLKETRAVLDSPQAKALQQELADAAITVIRNRNDILPIKHLAHNSIAIVNIGADKNNTFTDYCRRYDDVDAYSATGAISPTSLSDISKHQIVVAAVYNDDEKSVEALASLKNVKGLVTIFFTAPYKVSKFKGSIATPDAVMMAYANTVYTCKAAAMAIFGGIKVDGRLPVNIAGIGTLGDGISLKKTRLGYSAPASKGMDANLQADLDAMVTEAMNKGAFPGAQLIVVKDGDIIIDGNYGLTTKGGQKVTPSTLYDLASVSKTVGTLPGVMKAYDLGLFDLDTQAYNYIPGLNVDGKREITPRMLLYHETGMPASLNMFETMMDTATYKGKVVVSKSDKDHSIYINGGGYGHNTAKMRTDITSPVRTNVFNIETAKGIFVGQPTYDSIMAKIYRANIKPERKYVYSCLNFCLLMDLEQRVTGQPHQTWVTDSIWAPIGANSMCYRPTEKFPLSRIAATEKDTYLRKQHMHGYVHDELADFSGGVQGNAGVFGCATDLAKLCQMWLNGGWYGDARILSDKTTKLFTTQKSPTCRRGLGFDKPDMKNKDNSPCCDEASASVYGHTGFTGTCFWVDPGQKLIFIFLSNRVDPSRKNKAFSESSIRPRLMSKVYQSIGK